ncbi:glycosylated lysosomal membrane protein isoform X3 [Chiroxiphia lanceolata]|uniref:glycosylated lysosomal membrane protein isoform X3 n=1 Tax=Chiroxiphia lanceolata TaxID=296741 RepID=UPI0013CE4C6E|nr:glycosylated lysosomal membrane protein isoform X3 [Chiroxiphia lanceolata]
MAAGAGLVALVSLVAAVAAGGTEGDWKVSLEFNPGWNGSLWNGSWVNVVHVRAQGPLATLHWVWSSLGAPSVLLVASGSPRSRLSIDWARLLSPEPAGALRVHPPGSVSSAGAVAFTKLFEEKAPGEGFFQPYDLAEFSWENSNVTLDPSALTFRLRGIPGSDPAGAFANGSLEFQVRALPSPGRSVLPPGLPEVPGGCELRFQLSGVSPLGNGSRSRFLLEVAALDGAGARRELRLRRELDDEFAPGVFETQSLVAQSQSGSPLSFLLWRSIAYGSPSARRQDGIRCRAGELRGGPVPVPPIARAYFGEGGPGTPLGSSALNVSFGGDGDGDVFRDVYRERRFLRWSVLVGFGEPPRDTFSPLIISVVAVALGTPLALLLGGTGLVLLVPRSRYSEYEPIN